MSVVFCTKFCTNVGIQPEALRDVPSVKPVARRYGYMLIDMLTHVLHAGGLGFDSPHLHHLIKHRIAPGVSPGALHITYLYHFLYQLEILSQLFYLFRFCCTCQSLSGGSGVPDNHDLRLAFAVDPDV